jgi:hypothetical protein
MRTRRVPSSAVEEDRKEPSPDLTLLCCLGFVFSLSSASFHSSTACVMRMCSVGLCSYLARTRWTVSARRSLTTLERLAALLLGLLRLLASERRGLRLLPAWPWTLLGA